MNTLPSYFRKTAIMGVYVLFFIVAMIAINPVARSWNDQSRMATIKALVEKGELIIDESPFITTGDKVFINGHFYSDKLPAPAVIGAVVYWPIYYMGLSLDVGLSLSYFLITLFTVKMFWLSGLVAFYAALGLAGMSTRNRIMLAAALGFSSLYFTWSSTFNNHIIAASSLMVGFYFWLRSKDAGAGVFLFLSGFFFALAGISDAIAGIFFMGFFLLAVLTPTTRRKVFFFALPLAVTVVPTVAVNYFITGSVMPVNIKESFFQYPGSPWFSPAGSAAGFNEQLSGTRVNSMGFAILYAFQLFFGAKGFVLYNPLLLIAMPCLYREVRSKRIFAEEAMTIFLCSSLMALYFILYSSNFGGGSYSIRWFVPLLPLLFFFIYNFFDQWSSRQKIIFFGLFGISLVIAGVGLINPWSDISRHNVPFLANLIYLMDVAGKFSNI